LSGYPAIGQELTRQVSALLDRNIACYEDALKALRAWKREVKEMR
jgi:hypothetical protein